MNRKSEVLFLLVGKNPLPNYVAAKLLTDTSDGLNKPIICLIFSEETKDYAKYLKNVLGEEKYKFFYGKVNPWNYTSIKDEVNAGINAVKQLAENNPDLKFTVGLNYTGGTKAMAVHAYRAMKHLEDNGIEVHYSYLDSSEKAMRFDVEDGSQNNPVYLNSPTESEFEKVKLSLDELIDLHGWKKLEPPQTEPRFTNTLNAVMNTNRIASSRNTYYNEIRRDCFRQFERSFKDSKGFYAHNISRFRNEYEAFLRNNVINIDSFQNIKVALIEDFDDSVVENNKLVLGNLSDSVSAIDLCKFLDSFWLEDYVLQQVKANETTCQLHDSCSNFEIKIPRTNKSFFEIDVLTMRGYQLFAISCTILTEKSGKKKIKQKLFEIVHRAKQLGGAEAQIGLVCLANETNIRYLEEELKDDHIQVFGVNDLMSLKDKFKYWFEGN